MTFQSNSIRAFIGAKNYAESRQFYQELGFEKVEIGGNMTLFKVNKNLAFYLQDAYVKDWVDNSMLFLEVDDLEKCWKELTAKGLQQRYELVKIGRIVENDWGNEFFFTRPVWRFMAFWHLQIIALFS